MNIEKQNFIYNDTKNLDLSHIGDMNLKLDHYNLNVRDAKKVANFHISFLGFQFLKKELVNTGGVDQGQYDMINYILRIPSMENTYCVISEGLIENSIVNIFIDKFGEGINHIAFTSSIDIEIIFNKFKHLGIKTTTKKVINDKNVGLKQFFINKEYVGYFIEFIQRPNNDYGSEIFTSDNIASLINSTKRYLLD